MRTFCFFSYFVCFLLVFHSNVQAKNVHDLSTWQEQTAAYTVPVGLTEQEKKWFVAFQEGNFLINGWQDITAAILKKTPKDKLDQQRQFLKVLGEKIGLEWCKDNKKRKVSTDMLKSWGSEIKVAVKQDDQELQGVLAGIEREVDTLLN